MYTWWLDNVLHRFKQAKFAYMIVRFLLTFATAQVALKWLKKIISLTNLNSQNRLFKAN